MREDHHFRDKVHIIKKKLSNIGGFQGSENRDRERVVRRERGEHKGKRENTVVDGK